MYSSLSSATHHIFFPPRLEVVAEEQNPDGFPSHPRNQLRLTASSATRRTVQRARPSGGSLHTMAMIRCFWLSSSTAAAPGRCFSYSAAFQTALLVAMADLADRLRGQRDHAGNPRRADAFGQLQQRQGPQDDPHLLHAAAQQLCKFLLILLRDIDTSEVDGPYPEYAPKQFDIKMVFRIFSGGQRTSLLYLK